jgi:hypothetical protein
VVSGGPEADPTLPSASSGERSRRELLTRAGGALGVAALVAGCTSKVAQPSNVHIDKNAQGAARDVTLLNALLALEYRSIAAYTDSIPLLPQPQSPPEKPQNQGLFAPPPKAVNPNAPAPALKLMIPLAYAAAQQFLTQELAHVNDLKGLIKQAGGHPVKPDPFYDFGHPKTKQEVLMLLHRTEEMLLRSYHHATPLLTPAPLRGAAAALFANHAQHSSILRLVLGLPPIPSAFVSSE